RSEHGSSPQRRRDHDHPAGATDLRTDDAEQKSVDEGVDAQRPHECVHQQRRKNDGNEDRAEDVEQTVRTRWLAGAAGVRLLLRSPDVRFVTHARAQPIAPSGAHQPGWLVSQEPAPTNRPRMRSHEPGHATAAYISDQGRSWLSSVACRTPTTRIL